MKKKKKKGKLEIKTRKETIYHRIKSFAERFQSNNSLNSWYEEREKVSAMFLADLWVL